MKRFRIIAKTIIIIEPKIIGFNKKSYETAPSIITIGFPPAGGWVTPSSIITKIPRPTAIAICKNWSMGKNFKINIPTIDVTKCPKKTFLGWAKGLSGYRKSKTIEDPNEPAKNNP